MCVIKVRGDGSFLLNPLSTFADRNIDDSYIIAQMEVGVFHMLRSCLELTSSAF